MLYMAAVSALSHLRNRVPRELLDKEIERQLLKRIAEIGAKTIAEIVFAVGRSSQGLYLRIDFLPYVDEIAKQESKKASEGETVVATNMAVAHAPIVKEKIMNDVGVSCCGDFTGADDAPITLEIHFKTYGGKGDVSIQTGTPMQR